NLVAAVGFTARHVDVAQEARGYLGANPIPLALAWWLASPEGGAAAGVESLLWTEACRMVDSLRLFCGEVERVRAVRAGGDDSEAGLVVQLEFGSGGIGVLTCATFARPEPRLELELMGRGWTMTLGAELGVLRLAERDKTTILRCLNSPVTDHVDAF